MADVPGMRGVPLSEEQRALLVDRRTELGLTQQELGAKVGRKAITIHTIEAGKFLPSPEVLERLCRVLSIDCNVNMEVTLSADGNTAVSETLSTIHKRRTKKKAPRKGRK